MIGTNHGLRTMIFFEMHKTPYGGHSGITSTYHIIKRLFYWPNMKEDLLLWVKKCDVCARNKSSPGLYPGLLQPLPIPRQAWTYISMDFIEGLPKSLEKDVIWVVVDRFTKYSHFIALSHPYTSQSIAKSFLDVYKLHGLPVSIVSDRDMVFTSSFWKELFKLLETQLHMSSSYHPQSDRQT